MLESSGRHRGNTLQPATPLRRRYPLRSAPLLPVAAGMVLGVWLDACVAVSVWLYVAVFAAVCVPAAFRQIRGGGAMPLLLLAAATCAGGALHLARCRIQPVTSIERYTADAPRITRLRGTVATDPRILKQPATPFARWTFGSDRTVFLLDVDAAAGPDGAVPATGRVRVTVDEVLLDLRVFEVVEVVGWLARLRPPQNPGGFDWSALLRRQGVVAAMRCKDRGTVRRLGPAENVAHAPATWLPRLRQSARRLLTDDLATGSPEQASLLEAMVLGHRSQLDRKINDVFIRAGCVHFLAVSGLHVGIVLGFVYGACRLVRAPARWRAWLMLVAAIAYAVLAEPRPPILRATVMAVLFCLSLLVRRPRSTLNWLALAAIVLILGQPATVFDVGFQLSFVAVLGVMLMAPALLAATSSTARLAGRLLFGQSGERPEFAALTASTPPWTSGERLRRVARGVGLYFVVGPLAVSCGAWLACLPIVLAHFHRIQLWSTVSSVAVFPLVSMTMLLGFAKLAVEAWIPSLGSFVGGALGTMNGVLVRVVEWFAALPGATVSARVLPAIGVVLYYLALAAFVWRFTPAAEPVGVREAGFEASERRRVRARTLVLVASLAVFVVTQAFPFVGRDRRGLAAVTFLAVGSGSATVIELPDGRTILYDSGTLGPFDVGKHIVVPYLRSRGIASIDRFFVSHPNLDHLNGVLSVLDEIPTGPVVVNGHFEARTPARSPGGRFLELLAERQHPVETLDPSQTAWEVGGLRFEYLWPPLQLPDGVTVNDTSTVLRLTLGRQALLLTGDIETFAQGALLIGGNLRADVLALPHHGSVEATTPAFIDAVNPQVVIRSSNERMADTHNGLADFVGDAELYNTADVGAVRVELEPDRYVVHLFRAGTWQAE